jgi:acyl transferase domain-containing protein
VSAAFRSVVERCDAVTRSLAGWAVSEVLLGAAGAPDLARVDVVQPVLVAEMVGLAVGWRSGGVTADAVLGHSQGEVAAAVVAGGLSVEEGCRVAVVRSRAVLALSGVGLMASLGASLEETERLLSPWAGRVVVAAPNSPRSTVVSGEAEAVLEVVDECDRRGLWCRLINVDYASHSSSMEAVRDEIVAGLEGLSGTASTARLWSTVSGGWLETEGLGAVHWFENLRRPVLFEPSLRGLADAGFTLFLEVSPHPVLVQAIDETLTAAGHPATAAGTLWRDHDEVESFLVALGKLAVRGYPVDWSGVFGPGDHAVVELPTDLSAQRIIRPDGGGPGAVESPSGDAPGEPESDAAEGIDELSDDELIALAFTGSPSRNEAKEGER